MVNREREEQYKTRRNFLARRKAERFVKLERFVEKVSVITTHRCPNCDAVDVVKDALEKLNRHG